MARPRTAARHGALGLVLAALAMMAAVLHLSVSFVEGAWQARGAVRPDRTGMRAIAVPEVPKEGDRVVFDGPDGAIIVAKVDGAYYAVDATCPHLGLPMKRGKIEPGADGPQLVCNFHNSCFRLKDGSCTKWVTGALGFQNDLIAGVMGNLGGKKQDINAYNVIVGQDGSLSLEKQ